MKTQLAMVIDASRCWDCKACMAACKTANKVPEGQWRNWIKSVDLDLVEPGGGRLIFQPGNCMHCSEPLCIKACPTGATYRNEADGTVLINRELCIGCGQCLPACPYGARFRHAELRVADKCDFCAERRAAGLEPACVATCPTKARAFGNLADPESEVARLLKRNESVQLVQAKSPTDPNIRYLGNPGRTDWPVEAQMPSAFGFWKNVAGPVVKIFVGFSALGFGAMLAKQLFLPDHPEEDRQPEEKRHE